MAEIPKPSDSPPDNPNHHEDTMGTPLRLLMVEDVGSDAKLILMALEKAGFRVSHARVENADGMRSAIEKETWDVVIADYNLPGFNAFAALNVLKETGSADIPFIVVSGFIGEETAVDLMKAGAHDYLMKDNLARLAPAVERELRDAGRRSTACICPRSTRGSQRISDQGPGVLRDTRRKRHGHA